MTSIRKQIESLDKQIVFWESVVTDYPCESYQNYLDSLKNDRAELIAQIGKKRMMMRKRKSA